jgi:ADP-heptose:LPS heptosyltransferase
MQRILVIKLSALGDFVLATGPMKAIRQHHKDARITLLTTKAFADWARQSGYFDDVWIDDRAKFFEIGKLWKLRQKLRTGNFDRVYDLQTSDRSDFYYLLMQPSQAEWSGTAIGGSHPHKNPNRGGMHTIHRQREQLFMAGITNVPMPDLSWINADVSRFNLPQNYVLLVPGAAPHRPAKRWPAENFAIVAEYLLRQGITPVLLGAKADQAPVDEIKARVPGAVNLLGQTSLSEIAVLGRGAKLALGNDTGPMHIIAPAGIPCFVLFSSDSNPDLCAPKGENVRILQESRLKDLPPDKVIATIRAITEENEQQYGRVTLSSKF